MSLCKEQRDKLSGEKKHKGKKWIKNQMNRWIRRQEKRDLENAPKKKAFFGWYW